MQISVQQCLTLTSRSKMVYQSQPCHPDLAPSPFNLHANGQSGTSSLGRKVQLTKRTASEGRRKKGNSSSKAVLVPALNARARNVEPLPPDDSVGRQRLLRDGDAAEQGSSPWTSSHDPGQPMNKGNRSPNGTTRSSQPASNSTPESYSNSTPESPPAFLSDPEIQALLSHSAPLPSRESKHNGQLTGHQRKGSSKKQSRPAVSHDFNGSPGTISADPPHSGAEKKEENGPLSGWPEWPWGFLARTRSNPSQQIAEGGLNTQMTDSWYAGPPLSSPSPRVAPKKRRPQKPSSVEGWDPSDAALSFDQGNSQESNNLDPGMASHWYAGPRSIAPSSPTRTQSLPASWETELVEQYEMGELSSLADADVSRFLYPGPSDDAPIWDAEDPAQNPMRRFLKDWPQDLQPERQSQNNESGGSGLREGRGIDGSGTDEQLRAKGLWGAGSSSSEGYPGGKQSEPMQQSGGASSKGRQRRDPLTGVRHQNARDRVREGGGRKEGATPSMGSRQSGKGGLVGLQQLVLELMRFALRSGHPPGTIPTPQQLREAKREDLERAVMLQGGWAKVSKLFGLSSPSAEDLGARLSREAEEYTERLMENPGQGEMIGPLSPQYSKRQMEQREKRILQQQPRPYSQQDRWQRQSQLPTTNRQSPKGPSLYPSELPGRVSGQSGKGEARLDRSNSAGSSIGRSRAEQQLEEQLQKSRQALAKAQEAQKKFKRWNSQGVRAADGKQLMGQAQGLSLSQAQGVSLGSQPGGQPRMQRQQQQQQPPQRQPQQWQQQQQGLPSNATPEIQAASPAQRNQENSAPLVTSSLQDRVKALESMLVSTRTALQEGRAALDQRQTELQKVRRDTIDELLRVQDSLEFRETEMQRTKVELRKARAEAVAMEGKMSAEFRDTRQAIEDRELELRDLKAQRMLLRLVRVVWPHEGSDVQIVGSFNGWASPIKLTRSGAGVFATTLSLYPGNYEVKFIVDGMWKVDPIRPIVYSKVGNENNVITVKK